MIKRFISMLLCVSLVIAAYSGCSSKSKNGNEKTNKQSTTASNFNPAGYPIVKEPITIKIMASADANVPTDYENMAYWKMVKEKTNIHPQWQVYKAEEFSQKKNLMFVSGEYPDVIMCGISADNEEQYGVEQKILIPLKEYINKDRMPVFTSLIQPYPEYVKQITATDGNIYSIPRAFVIDYTNAGHFFINKKWLDELKLGVPKTTAELENVLKAFKTKDPNRNGKNDEIGLEMTLWNGTIGMNNLFGLFGRADKGDHLALENDKVVFAADKPEYRKALEWISKMYNDGLIDPEAVSQDANTYYSKIKNGNVGCFIGWRILGMAFYYPGMEKDYVVMEPPVAIEGVNPQVARAYNGVSTGGIAVTSSNKYVNETLRWVDFLMEPDIAMQAKMGSLGKFQEKNKEGKFVIKNKPDGTPYSNAEIGVDCPASSGIYFLPANILEKIYQFQDVHSEKFPYCKLYEKYLTPQSSDLINLGRLSQVDRDARARILTDINRYVTENIIQFISKGITDNSWKAYTDTLQKMNLNEYINLCQKAYDSYNKK